MEMVVHNLKNRQMLPFCLRIHVVISLRKMIWKAFKKNMNYVLKSLCKTFVTT